MSIHIKGKLPTGRCEAQFFASGCVAFYDVEGKYLGESKWEELPPHGRLIDAGALRQAMYHEAFETDTPMQRWDSGCWIRFKLFERMEEAAPTIIPAEGGDAG